MACHTLISRRLFKSANRKCMYLAVWPESNQNFERFDSGPRDLIVGFGAKSGPKDLTLATPIYRYVHLTPTISLEITARQVGAWGLYMHYSVNKPNFEFDLVSGK